MNTKKNMASQFQRVKNFKRDSVNFTTILDATDEWQRDTESVVSVIPVYWNLKKLGKHYRNQLVAFCIVKLWLKLCWGEIIRYN